MIPLPSLAFVDLETSGLSPTANRITEIGVVTVDGNRVSEWTTLVNPGRDISEHTRLFNGISNDAVGAAPHFKDIATDLSQRLAGRIFIAHNARFDFGFLRAEFERVGVEFQPQVLCSVMLSRKLYPNRSGHDLDTLMERHGLRAEVRHRALPDAQLIWQFWQVIQSEHPQEHIAAHIEALLAGPVLPEHLDPSLIERLPEARGVYVLHGQGNAVLHVGKADNLKLHLRNYFRIDRTSQKALAISDLITNITWQVTHGTIGAQLQMKALASAVAPTKEKRAVLSMYAWKLKPDEYPCVELVALANRDSHDGDLYGLFDSERKARNALLRLATRGNLCHASLGIRQTSEVRCSACRLSEMSRCGQRADRLNHLTKTLVALTPLRLPTWPYDGPIGIKERSDLHILEDWCYLGTAQSEHEVHQVLETRRNEFDQATFAFLSKTLARLPKKSIVQLPPRSESHPEANCLSI